MTFTYQVPARLLAAPPYRGVTDTLRGRSYTAEVTNYSGISLPRMDYISHPFSQLMEAELDTQRCALI